uniref:Uncharacterized protein n=1 Tax=Rhizophora mucronata TaxID=61149 RepID=A0A2P2PC69_RHIMU
MQHPRSRRKDPIPNIIYSLASDADVRYSSYILNALKKYSGKKKRE